MPFNIFLVQGSKWWVLDAISNFPFTTRDIGTIVTPHLFDSTMDVDKPLQGLDEGIWLQKSIVFNVDSSAGETVKDAFLNFLSATAYLNMERTKEIHPHIGEGWLMWCKSGLQ